MKEITAQALYAQFMRATTLAGKEYMPYDQLPSGAKIGWENVADAVRGFVEDNT